ncbi:MAG: MMPL family transporter [Gammaproteobacteria bacterium]
MTISEKNQQTTNSPLRATGFILVTFFLVALALWTTELRTNIGDFFFPGDSADSGFLAGQIQSEEFSRRYLISITHQGIAETTATEFSDALIQQLEKTPDVKRIWHTQFNDNDMQRLLDSYQEQHVHLFSLNPEKDFPALFSAQGMTTQAQTLKEALLGPDPMLAKSILEHDPMLLTLNWFRKIGKQFNRPDNTAGYTSFFLETESSGLNAIAQTEIQNALQQIFTQLNAEYNQAFAFDYTGVPVYAVKIRNQSIQDISRISSLSMAAVILLSLLVFRSWRALLCTALVLTATVAVAVLITQSIFGHIHGLTLALGTTLVGVCIDYFIHSMVHSSNKQGIQRIHAIQQIWPTLMTGGATTIIGYIALSISGFPGLQQVAVFTGSGIITALILSRFVLPALMELFNVTITPAIDLQGLLKIAMYTGLRYAVFIIIGITAIIGIPQIHWGNDLNMMAPEIKKLQAKDIAIRSRMASLQPGRFILIEGNTTEEALQTSEALLPTLKHLQAQGELQAFYPPYPWLASQQLQSRNQQAWESELSPNTRQNWENAVASAGLNATALPHLENKSTPLLELDQLRNSPAWQLLSRQFMHLPDKTTIAIWLGEHNPEALRSTLANISDVRYFSQKDSIDQLATAYRHRAQSMLVAGILAIFVILLIRYRSFTSALRALLPAALAVLLLLGAWGLSGASMGMLHLIGLLLTAAVCVDYGIFFMENKSDNTARTFQAITVSALTTSVAFACLGAAENPAMHALAWTVAPGVLAGFLLCPLMLRNNN